MQGLKNRSPLSPVSLAPIGYFQDSEKVTSSGDDTGEEEKSKILTHVVPLVRVGVGVGC